MATILLVLAAVTCAGMRGEGKMVAGFSLTNPGEKDWHVTVDQAASNQSSEVVGMATPPLISLCVPTHDGRGWSLKLLIESILPQLKPDLAGRVEICVSDNGSVDSTETLLRDYSHRYPGLFTCHRFPRNVGGRLNMLKVAEMARGEYLWLLGSDDVLESNAISVALDQIRRFPDVAGFCFNRTRYNQTLTEVVDDFPLHHPENPGEHHVYTDANTIIAEMGVYQNYITGVLVKRAFWQEVVDAEGAEKITSYRHYTHSYVHARITLNHPVWAWVPDKIIRYRSDNDAYLATDTSQPCFIAEINDDMHRQFRDTLGIHSPGYRVAMLKMFKLWFQPAMITRWKLMPSFSKADEQYMLQTFVRTGWFIPAFWLSAFPRLLAPRGLYRLRYNLGLGTRLRALRGSPKTAIVSLETPAAPMQPALADFRYADPLLQQPPAEAAAEPLAGSIEYASTN